MLTEKENHRPTQVGPGMPKGDLLRRHWQPIAASGEWDENPVKPVKIFVESLVLHRDRSGGRGPNRRLNKGVA